MLFVVIFSIKRHFDTSIVFVFCFVDLAFPVMASFRCESRLEGMKLTARRQTMITVKPQC